MAKLLAARKPAAGGVMDIPGEAATQDAEQFPQLAGRVRVGLQESGFSTDIPEQMPPVFPDEEIFKNASRQVALTNLVHGLVGQRKVTPYGAKLGQRGGEVMQSPVWDAAEQEAALPWQAEQLRVNNANKLHAFVNQYAMMKSQARNADTHQALDLTMEEVRARGYLGVLGRQAEMQRTMMAPVLARLDQGERRLQISDQANARAEEKARRESLGNKNDWEAYASARAAQSFGQNVLNMLDDPEMTSVTRGGHFTLGQLRLAGKKGQALAQQIGGFHHYMLMADPRQAMRFGNSLLRDVLPHLTDDTKLDQYGIKQLMTMPQMITTMYDEKYPEVGRAAGNIHLPPPMQPGGDIREPTDDEMRAAGIK